MKKIFLLFLISLFAFTCKPLRAAINEVDPSLSPPPVEDSVRASRSGERNSLSVAAISANIILIGTLVLLIVTTKNSHAH